jgi:FAD/FMN-containing dehydrogenase
LILEQEQHTFHKVMRGILEGFLLLASLAHGFPQKRAAIDDCLTSAEVPVYASGSSDFTKAIKPFNLRLPFTPTALAVPSTVAQVQAAVSCGASLGITVSPKSGGHSYASHGLGGEDGHLVIDLKLFRNVSVDPSTGIATVGPGARLGNVATALYNQGKRALSHGTCPGYVLPVLR